MILPILLGISASECSKDFCRGVINCWNSVAVEQLLEGYCVDMGDVGYLHLSASSKGAITEEERLQLN